MSRLPVASLTAIVCLALLWPAPARSHRGPAMDHSGCHKDHREKNYHCHKGEMDNLYFRSKADMIKMRKTGEDTTIEAPEETFLGDLFGNSKRKAAKQDKKTGELEARVKALESQLEGGAAAQAAPAAAAGAPVAESAVQTRAAAPAPSSHSSFPVRANEAEDRLFRLKRLYEKGLITEEEYDAKRKEILDTL